MRAIRMWLARQCFVRIGSNRVVVEFVSFGLVLKFPIIHLVLLYHSIRGFFRGTACVSFFHWCIYPMDSEGFLGFRRLVFKGAADNWREYWFYLAEQHPFAQPTYFSLFGLMNIQLRGDPILIERKEFRRQLELFIGEQVLYSDPHHFASIGNFCVSGGKLRILDYGSLKTQRIIRERGMCVYRNFQIKSN